MTVSRSCLEGGGEAGERLRAVDWSSNPLGPVEGWPISLQTAVRIVLSSEFPMMLHWGPDLITVYNDAYAPSLGHKHPGHLGRPAREWWPEMWDQLTPIFDRVLSGRPYFVEDARYTPDRDGTPREAYFTHCHSPLWDDDGRIAGIFLVVTETTRRVLAERGLVRTNADLTSNEKRLAENEDYWRGLFEQLNEGFMVVEVVRDASGVARTWRFAEINDAWERISGLSRATATGRPVDEVIPGVEREWIDRYIRVAETGEPQSFRMSLQALGQVYEVRAFRVAPDRVGVLFQEISSRQREETRGAALLELAECLRDLDDPAEMEFATARILGRVLQVSRVGYATMIDGGEGLRIERDWTAPGFASGAGTHRTVTFGRAVADLGTGQPVIVADTAVDARTATEGRAGFEAYAVRAVVNWPLIENGRLVAFLYANDGKPRDWRPEEIAFIRTVAEQTRIATARRRAETELRALNASLERQVRERTAELRLYRDIVQSDVSPIVACDTTHRLIGFNRAHHAGFRAVMGHDQQVGENLPDLFSPDQAAILRGLMDRALGGETFSVIQEFGDEHRSKPSWEITYTPLRDEDGTILGAFHHARDVTARLRAERELNAVQEQLRQSQKMDAVGQLTGGVAHDFNNLLTVIKSSTDLLKRPDLAEARRLRYVTAISDTVDRAAKLTGQLLAFARRQALKPEVFAASDSVHSLTDMVGTLTGSRIRVETELPAHPCFVNADPSQFDTALVNLTVNARDAIDGEGRITIRVRPVQLRPAVRLHPAITGDFVAIDVIDTGRGIPTDALEHIFEPFFTTKAVGQGTGLGLSQVFGFAKQSGGEITVESEVGRGTTFTLYLPRVAAPEVSGPGSEPAALVDGHGIRVLVVEDNAEVGTFAVQTLADLGYVPVLAGNAEEALAALDDDAEGFDVVFSDVMMPGMNGIELGQEIRRRHHDLPVLLASGYSHLLAQNGTFGFELLHKPYSVDQLSRLLRKVAPVKRRRGPGGR